MERSHDGGRTFLRCHLEPIELHGLSVGKVKEEGVGRLLCLPRIEKDWSIITLLLLLDVLFDGSDVQPRNDEVGGTEVFQSMKDQVDSPSVGGKESEPAGGCHEEALHGSPHGQHLSRKFRAGLLLDLKS